MEQGLRKTTTVRMRNYGRIIQDMVQLAVDEQDVEKKKDNDSIYSSMYAPKECVVEQRARVGSRAIEG